jgi:hypothetical protein
MSQHGVGHFLGRSLVFSIIGVLFVVGTMMPHGAMAAPITGTATGCSSFYTCAYTIVNGLGSGSAATYPYYNYFSANNTYVNFQLPGQAKPTTNQPYRTNIIGQVGSTVHVGGSFITVDANTGKMDAGTTDDYIIQTQRCGRHGCWYTYSLSSGKITFTLTNIDGTTTSLACNPETFSSGGSTVCTVTVTNLANSKYFATGRVAFSFSNNIAYGTFTPSTCLLSSGSCSVRFAPVDESVGGIGITASYPGDPAHYKSSGSSTVDVIAN